MSAIIASHSALIVSHSFLYQSYYSANEFRHLLVCSFLHFIILLKSSSRVELTSIDLIHRPEHLFSFTFPCLALEQNVHAGSYTLPMRCSYHWDENSASHVFDSSIRLGIVLVHESTHLLQFPKHEASDLLASGLFSSSFMCFLYWCSSVIHSTAVYALIHNLPLPTYLNVALDWIPTVSNQTGNSILENQGSGAKQ